MNSCCEKGGRGDGGRQCLPTDADRSFPRTYLSMSTDEGKMTSPGGSQGTGKKSKLVSLLRYLQSFLAGIILPSSQ